MEIDKSTPELLEREKIKVTEAEVIVRRCNTGFYFEIKYKRVGEVVWVILTNYIISYLRDISRLVDKGFENIEKAIYDSVKRIIKYLNKRD